MTPPSIMPTICESLTKQGYFVHIKAEKYSVGWIRNRVDSTFAANLSQYGEVSIPTLFAEINGCSSKKLMAVHCGCTIYFERPRFGGFKAVWLLFDLNDPKSLTEFLRTLNYYMLSENTPPVDPDYPPIVL